jgi:hypothetical protein
MLIFAFHDKISAFSKMFAEELGDGSGGAKTWIISYFFWL